MKKNIGNTTIDNGTNKDDKLDDDIADDDTIGNDDSIEDDDDTSGDDDTTGDDDDPSNQKGPRDEKSNIYLIISVIACIFLILFVIISAIIILNRRRKRNQEADHIIEGDVNTSRPVNWEEEYNQEFESETSEIPSKERSDEYPVGYDIPIEENPFIDKSDAEKRDSFTYVTYESVSCQICFGNVKPGDTVYRCSCGKTFHTSCADRVGECPLCEKEIITQYPSVPKVEYESFQDDNSKEEEISEVHDDDDEYYGPQKYAGEILTSDSDETEIPQIVTTADVSTPQGCYHLYNMLLAKKGLDMRIGSLSSKSDINKARKQIILMFHPDKWIENKDRATFFMQKVNVAWEVLSTIPRE